MNARSARIREERVRRANNRLRLQVQKTLGLTKWQAEIVVELRYGGRTIYMTHTGRYALTGSDDGAHFITQKTFNTLFQKGIITPQHYWLTDRAYNKIGKDDV
jgi:hypothetical protein